MKKSRNKGTWKKKQWLGPVVLPSVIEAYLNQPVDDYAWIKQCSRSDILEAAPPLDFFTDPRLHQLACTWIAICEPCFLFFLDTGAGKTKLILDAIHFRKVKHKQAPFLVLVPAVTNTEGWGEEIALHRPELKVVKLIGSRKERQELLTENADLCLLNYEGLQSYVTKLERGRGRVIDHKAAQDFGSLFSGVVLDESHQIGNRSSLRFRMCYAVSKHMEVRYALTGTPFGRNPEKLWSQFFIVDHGDTLGQTLGLFRAAFFHAKENYWGGVDYTFDQHKMTQLNRLIRHRSIRYRDEEFSDLPRIVRKVHRLSFGVDAKEYYEKVLGELRASRGKFEEQKNSFIRMRQVCAGFLSLRGEDEQKIEVSFYTSPKIEELETLIDGVEEDEKLIIYHEFIRSGDLVTDMLTRKRVRWARIGGGKKARNPVEQMRKFLDDPLCRVLVYNYKSGGGTGHNFHKICRRIIYYESPVDPIVRTQTERRITGGLRTGAHHVFIHDLTIKNSIDDVVLGFLKQGRDLFQAIIEGRVVL